MTDNINNLIDTETTTILLDALEDGFYDVVKEFIKVGRDIITQIEQQAVANTVDTEKLIVLIHTLKGASGNIGACSLAEKCRILENQLHNKQALDINVQSNEIADIYSKTEAAFLQTFSKGL